MRREPGAASPGSFDGEVRGINDLREEYIETYGQDPGAAYYTAGDYVPVVPVTYWSFRFMIGLGARSKNNTAWAFLTYLRDAGRACAERWLEDNRDQIGERSTLDLEEFRV